MSCPENRIATEFMVPFQVIDLSASKLFPWDVIKKEQSELPCLVTRIEHHRRAIHREVNAASSVHNFKVRSDARPDLKLITNPKPAVWGVVASLNDCVIDFLL